MVKMRTHTVLAAALLPPRIYSPRVPLISVPEYTLTTSTSYFLKSIKATKKNKKINQTTFTRVVNTTDSFVSYIQSTCEIRLRRDSDI